MVNRVLVVDDEQTLAQNLQAYLQAQGLELPVLGYYPQLVGTPTVLAATGDHLPVYLVVTTHTNQGGPLAALA